MEALDALLNRVSVARLTDPAPDAAQREALFQAALRAPDHGQLRPWRFLTVEGQGREALGELFAQAMQAKGEQSPEKLDKARGMPLRAPLLIVVIATLHDHPKVPAYEQRLAAGCAAHGILLAAHAQGIGAVWRTGDLAYDAHVQQGLGLTANEEVIGYMYVGTPAKEPRDAPVLQTQDFVQAWG
ncbi:nitroreductase [Pseudomonas sp.]|uniref:nitroreductase family protein n=1 Tax=Pseudomonas sp. TaxID=306 RepID=UPI0028A643C7|nr:nitroreductase [Pseudomonas sp.]